MSKTLRVAPLRRPVLEYGSDNEIAEFIEQTLRQTYSGVVFDLGRIYVWDRDHWRPLLRPEIVGLIRKFDRQEPKIGGAVKLNKARIESIRTILEIILEAPEYFSDRPIGVNCRDGFITFDRNGVARIAEHHPDQRQLFVLDARWRPGPVILPEDSLLAILLDRSFRGDADGSEKASILAEAAGVAALGLGTRMTAPKALILYGPSAENGKSQILALFRSLLPDCAHTAVSPSRMGDDRYVIQLAGPVLNATDEMGEAAIFSEAFKSAVTGDWMMGRDVYKSALRFQPRALNVLATNRLPSFKGGMDAGVRRRLLVVQFNRRIPLVERVEDIGRLVGERERDLLLAWAVEGASRVLARDRFADLYSSREAIADWILFSDPVGGWLLDREEVDITGDPADELHSKLAYQQFRAWTKSEGIIESRIPAKATFTQRVKSSGIAGLTAVRRSTGYVFLGICLAQSQSKREDEVTG